MARSVSFSWQISWCICQDLLGYSQVWVDGTRKHQGRQKISHFQTTQNPDVSIKASYNLFCGFVAASSTSHTLTVTCCSLVTPLIAHLVAPYPSQNQASDLAAWLYKHCAGLSQHDPWYPLEDARSSCHSLPSQVDDPAQKSSLIPQLEATSFLLKSLAIVCVFSIPLITFYFEEYLFNLIYLA